MVPGRSVHVILASAAMLTACAAKGSGQAVPTRPPARVPPEAATQLEGFRPAAGTVVTFGYNELGKVGGVSVDSREIRDAKGAVVRGLFVEVTQSEYKQEGAFVDTDELPELLNGIEAVLAVRTNPTKFQNFEVRYKTKGELQITAFSNRGGLGYAVQAGRVTHAQVFLDEKGVRSLAAMFQTAKEQLTTP